MRKFAVSLSFKIFKNTYLLVDRMLSEPCSHDRNEDEEEKDKKLPMTISDIHLFIHVCIYLKDLTNALEVTQHDHQLFSTLKITRVVLQSRSNQPENEKAQRNSKSVGLKMSLTSRALRI
jgi:hypothetical protein